MDLKEKEKILLELRDEIITSEDGTFQYQPPQPPVPPIVSITIEELQNIINSKSVEISNIDISISEENQKILDSQSKIESLRVDQNKIIDTKTRLETYLPNVTNLNKNLK